MLVKVAWRNIWRHKVRSLVLIAAIALGLLAGVFATAFVNGMMQGKVDIIIELELSHLQVHHPDFKNELTPALTISRSQEILSEIRKEEVVKGASGRIVSMMMMASPNKNGAARVMGVVPDDEKDVSVIEDLITEGSFFDHAKRNPIIISKRMADDYKVGLRSKVVLTFQDTASEITSAAFRVHGIFDTRNGVFDETNVYVRRSDISDLMRVGNEDHEIAVLLNDHEFAETVAGKYAALYPEYDIKAWMDQATGMRYMIEAMDTYLYWIVGIILLALLFSIVNTMLMAVLERVREFGMLMAIGMSKVRIFSMIMLETVFLSMIGGPLGLLIAYGLVNYFGSIGINVAAAAYGEMGFGTVIHPYLENESYWSVTFMVLIMSIVAAIYPAIKALSLNPVEAIRKI